MSDPLFCIFEKYQTLIVGALGFAGVIITMIHNARIQRQHKNEALQHETDTMRVAIRSELLANKKAYELRIKQFNEETEYTNALIQNKLINNIYTELIPKIGLLSEIEIEKIISVYSLLAEVPYRMRILVGTDNIGGFENEYIRIKEEHHTQVKLLHEKVVPQIEAAINEIDSNRVHA